jgi:hypothetical protein
MSRLLDLSIGVTRSWTATYTRGLPHDTRAERREEIDSDLWDHKRLADLEREPANGTAMQILVRVALGIPADLLWRMEAGSSTQLTRSTSVNDTWFMRIGLLALTLVLSAGVAMGGFIVAGEGEWDNRTEQVIWGLVFATFPLISIIGLWICRSQPKLGVGLVAAGMVLMSLVMFWIAFITVPVGILVVAFAIKRSGLAIWPFRPSTTGPTGTA